MISTFPTDYKTDPAVLKALSDAAGTEMTREQVREQKISYALGMLGAKSKATRADIEKLIEEQDGKAA
ncbi:MAG: hypothetical protein GDA52_02590 [Rhodobacteraceae bacterium]|nr:hypothetical protein [Paracoccaceae bacterium]